MPLLTIHHLIYTRVEPEYSPTHKNGFQTVYASPAIQANVAAIEKRVQCFMPGTPHVEQGIAEFQYFWLDTEQAVIVRTQAIEGHPGVIDKMAGRTGHFVSHALIVGREQFEKVGNDPFAVIEEAEQEGIFTEDVEMLVGYLRHSPPVAQLSVRRRERFNESLDGWTANSLEKWALLAQSANDLTSGRESLLLLSNDPDTIYSLLSAALFIMDKKHRVYCTFNTFVDGCMPSTGSYWAAGASKRQSGSGFITIDLDTHALEVRQKIAPKAFPYSMWLQQNLKSCIESSEGMTELYTAQIAAECLAVKCSLPDEPLKERALETFREVNVERYTAGLQKGLDDALGPQLGRAIAPQLPGLVGIRDIIDAGARETIDPVTFAPSLCRWVIKHHATVKSWNKLFKFAIEARYAPLTVITATKATSGLLGWLDASKKLAAKHAALDLLAKEGSLDQWLGILRIILKESDLVTGVTAPLIAARLEPAELDNESFVELAVALLKYDGSLLDMRYTKRVRKIKDKDMLKKLARSLKTASGIPDDFAAAVQTNS